MRLLGRPQPYIDESLESYMIRLSDDNGYDTYQTFSRLVWLWLEENDPDAGGAFPQQLDLLNVYHADRTSNLRVRALRLIESLIDVQKSSLLKLAIMHSAVKFSGSRVAVFRDGIDIPRCFLSTNFIPICPHCLEEALYIRQQWHYLPYVACHKHKCQLVSHCPECGVALNYQQLENIRFCQCGFDLRFAQAKECSQEQLAVSKLIVEQESIDEYSILHKLSLSARMGAILWFCIRQKGKQVDQIIFNDELFIQAVEYFEHWPTIFHSELEQAAEQSEERLLRPYNQTAFSHIFGSLLPCSSRLPMRDLGRNFILKEVVEYLGTLVWRNPRAKQPNIADILLNAIEVAALLSTRVDQVIRLYQQGYIKRQIPLKQHENLQPYRSAFLLREVVELKLAKMQPQLDFNQVYTTQW